MQDRFTKWVELSPRCVPPPRPRRYAEADGTNYLPPRMSTSTDLRQREAIYRPADATALTIVRDTATHGTRARPHCDSVERTNKTIKTMIAQYMDRNH